MFRAVRSFLGQVQKATSLRGYDVREELVLWDFRQTEVMNEWSCIGDKDIGGYSEVLLQPNGKGWQNVSAGNLSYLIYYCWLQELGPSSMAT